MMNIYIYKFGLCFNHRVLQRDHNKKYHKACEKIKMQGA